MRIDEVLRVIRGHRHAKQAEQPRMRPCLPRQARGSSALNVEPDSSKVWWQSSSAGATARLVELPTKVRMHIDSSAILDQHFPIGGAIVVQLPTGRKLESNQLEQRLANEPRKSASDGAASSSAHEHQRTRRLYAQRGQLSLLAIEGPKNSARPECERVQPSALVFPTVIGAFQRRTSPVRAMRESDSAGGHTH